MTKLSQEDIDWMNAPMGPTQKICKHKDIIKIIKTVCWCKDCGAIKSNNTNSEWKLPTWLRGVK